MTDFNRTKKLKIRKPHECEQCGRTIPAGEVAYLSTGNFEGYWYTKYAHLECEQASLAYAKKFNCWGDEYPFFQHMDGEPDEWLLEHYPVVAERLGVNKDAEE